MESLSRPLVIRDVFPMACILRLFGLFPARVSRDCLRFSYTSLLTIASIFHVVVCWGIPFTVLLLKSKSTLARKGQLSIYGLQIFLKHLPGTLTFGNIVNLVQLIIKFDETIGKKPKTIHRIFWFALSLSIFTMYLGIAYYFSFTNTLTSFLTRPLVALIWQKECQQAVLFAFFAHQLQSRFTLVKEMVETPMEGRLAHASMSECVRVFSKAFELRMFVTIISTGSDYLLNVYMNTYHQGEANQFTVVAGILDAMAGIYFPAKLSTNLIKEAYAVEDVLLNVSLTGKDEKFCQEIGLFLEEVRGSRLEVTAWGVFSLDTGLYGSFFNTLLTFFIAMAQFYNEIMNIINRYGLNT